MKSLGGCRQVRVVLATLAACLVLYTQWDRFSGQPSLRYVTRAAHWKDYRDVRDKKPAEPPSLSTSTNSPDLERTIHERMESANRAGLIRNRHLIERQLAAARLNASVPLLVLLVQVHSRVDYLRALIDSLRETSGIGDSLVVFSHDLDAPDVNKLVESVEFCATLQIFYPLGLQVRATRFPGADACDCPKSLKKSEALLMNCCNAAYPDTFGHHREAEFVQIKHHWTWKLAHVFDTLAETRDVVNLKCLLLEEDHFLMPDAIHVLNKLSEKILSDIDVVSLAIFKNMKQNHQIKDLKKYAKAIWHSSSHNTGFMLSRPQWNMLKDCSHAFCTYDDYNWDWSIQYVSQRCFKSPLVAIFPSYSRVFHIGTCGIHHKGKKCDPSEQIAKVKSVYTENRKEFFASSLELADVNTGIKRAKKPNGGWSDPRDHQLCKRFFWASSMMSSNVTTTSDIIYI